MTDPKEKQRIAVGIRKAEVIDWLSEKLRSGATKVVVLCGTPQKDDNDVLKLTGVQIGFEYTYEVDGFFNLCVDVIDWDNGKEIHFEH